MVRALGDEQFARLAGAGRPLTRRMLAGLGPVLILVPHPDDETLGCGGLISRAVEAQIDLHVVYLTDGSASHRKSRSWSRTRLAERRRTEALAALAELGLAAAQTTFLDWPDAAPYASEDARHEDTVQFLLELCRERRVRSLFGPWSGEEHCDHQAASRLLDVLEMRLRPRPRRFDYLVWGWSHPGLADGALEGPVWRLACAKNASRRARALARHETQLGLLIRDDEEAFVIPPELAALTSRPSEIYLEHP